MPADTALILLLVMQQCVQLDPGRDPAEIKVGVGLAFSWVSHWSDSSHCSVLVGVSMRRRGRRVGHPHLKVYLDDRSFVVHED